MMSSRVDRTPLESIDPRMTATTAMASSSRWFRPVMVGLTLLLLMGVAIGVGGAWDVVTHDPRVHIGVDLEIMRELGRRWNATGSMYLAYQLSGPYSIDATPELTNTPALYPPAVGPIF